LVLPVVLALPDARRVLEADMFTHMLVQFPLLIAAGICLGLSLPLRLQQRVGTWNYQGITGLVMTACITTFWMVPLALDLVLVQPWLEAAKWSSLMLAGCALALSWPHAGLIAKGFFLGNLLPMLAVAGWLYAESPVRLCNAYLTTQQETTGQALIWLSIVGAILWLAGFFVGEPLPVPYLKTTQKHEENCSTCRFHTPH